MLGNASEPYSGNEHRQSFTEYGSEQLPLFFFYECLGQMVEGIQVLAGKLLGKFQQPVDAERIGFVGIEIFHGRDAQIAADIEKAVHGREGFPVFNAVDIARVLTDINTHPAG